MNVMDLLYTVQYGAEQSRGSHSLLLLKLSPRIMCLSVVMRMRYSIAACSCKSVQVHLLIALEAGMNKTEKAAV